MESFLSQGYFILQHIQNPNLFPLKAQGGLPKVPDSIDNTRPTECSAP